jgi:hypothetical protein
MCALIHLLVCVCVCVCREDVKQENAQETAQVAQDPVDLAAQVNTDKAPWVLPKGKVRVRIYICVCVCMSVGHMHILIHACTPRSTTLRGGRVWRPASRPFSASSAQLE